MRVAFVNATHRWGGVKSWSLRVARGLVDRKHEVTFFVRPDTPFVEACQDLGLHTEPVRFGFDWNPLAVRKIKNAFRDHRVEIAVTNVSKDNRIAGPACRALGIPVLMRVGGPGDVTDRRKIRFEQARYVDRVVVPAAAIKDTLSRLRWMDAENRVTVVPNGVDLSRFRPGAGKGTLRRLLDLPETVPVVVTTGQLTAIKGHDLLLRAVADLQVTPPPALAFIGTGKEEERLRGLARSLGIETRVHFLGFRRDVPDLLEDAAVAVQPSLQEGFPNSVIEFMAKGKAVIATRLSGTPEAIHDGEHGLLIPAGDTAALTRSLERVLTDEELRLRLGKAARARAQTEYGEEQMVDRVESLLREMTS